jgi:malate dehydrogenase (oxaloacetate-decarboxylating)
MLKSKDLKDIPPPPQGDTMQSRIIASSKTKNLVPIRTNIRGSELLNTPRLNKGAAFTREERAIFGLEGMLPYEVHDLDKQVSRAYNQLQKQPTVILKHAFLASMRDQNQVLFYRLMQDHLKELLGILYTPGAAEAVMGYSYLFRRPLGCFLSFPNQDGMRAQLESHVESMGKQSDLTALASRTDSASLIDLIVVTDSEAVLGIGGEFWTLIAWRGSDKRIHPA